MNSEPTALQIVIASRLADASHRAEFLRLSALLKIWLAKQPGFLRYELYETANGWFDAMLWRDQAAADAGNAAFAQTDICRGFAEIVEPGYHVLSGQSISLAPPTASSS